MFNGLSLLNFICFGYYWFPALINCYYSCESRSDIAYNFKFESLVYYTYLHRCSYRHKDSEIDHIVYRLSTILRPRFITLKAKIFMQILTCKYFSLFTNFKMSSHIFHFNIKVHGFPIIIVLSHIKHSKISGLWYAARYCSQYYYNEQLTHMMWFLFAFKCDELGILYLVPCMPLYEK